MPEKRKANDITQTVKLPYFDEEVPYSVNPEKPRKPASTEPIVIIFDASQIQESFEAKVIRLSEESKTTLDMQRNADRFWNHSGFRYYIAYRKVIANKTYLLTITPMTNMDELNKESIQTLINLLAVTNRPLTQHEKNFLAGLGLPSNQQSNSIPSVSKSNFNGPASQTRSTTISRPVFSTEGNSSNQTESFNSAPAFNQLLENLANANNDFYPFPTEESLEEPSVSDNDLAQIASLIQAQNASEAQRQTQNTRISTPVISTGGNRDITSQSFNRPTLFTPEQIHSVPSTSTSTSFATHKPNQTNTTFSAPPQPAISEIDRFLQHYSNSFSNIHSLHNNPLLRRIELSMNEPPKPSSVPPKPGSVKSPYGKNILTSYKIYPRSGLTAPMIITFPVDEMTNGCIDEIGRITIKIQERAKQINDTQHALTITYYKKENSFELTITPSKPMALLNQINLERLLNSLGQSERVVESDRDSFLRSLTLQDVELPKNYTTFSGPK